MAAHGGESIGRGRAHVSLVAILAGFFVLSLVYAWLIPPFEGPDEAQHFAYVVWLAEGKGLPPRGPASWDTPLQQEAGQPPLYYALASLIARLVGTGNPEAVYRENPYYTAPLPRAVFDNDNRALHYPGEGEPLRGGWLALYLARGLSLLFGLGLIVSVHGVARELFGSTSGIALGAAFLVAFTPQVIYISSVVSNDIPAAALSALALWLYVRLLTGQAETRRDTRLSFASGAVLGLAGMTKVSPLLLILPFGAGLVWLGWSGRRSWLAALRLIVLLGLGVAVVAGWWFIAGWLRDGSAAGLSPHDGAPWAITDAASQLPPLAERWLEVGRSYLVALGWGTIRPGAWVYGIALALVALALLGWAITWRRWRRDIDRPPATTLAALGVLALALIVMAIFLEMWMRRVTAPHGRLLFPAITAVVIGLLMGWRALDARLPLLAYAFTLLLAAAVPFTLILPAYTAPPLRAGLPSGIGWRFGDEGQPPFAELVSVTPAQRSVDAGEVLPVEICWRALGQPERDYAVFLQLIGPNNALVASRYTYPGQGLRPTSTWRAGESWCEWLHIRAPENVVQTLVYRLQVGLIDDETDQRLNGTDAAGAPLPHTFIDAVRVVAAPAPSLSALAPTVQSGDALQLVDYALPAGWQAGREHSFQLTWSVVRPVDRDLQLFVHLRDPQTAEVVAQADGPPLGGWYPTSWWERGEVISDSRSFALPDDLPSGDYELVVGWYDLVTEERAGSEIRLGLIRVLP